MHTKDLIFAEKSDKKILPFQPDKTFHLFEINFI